MMFLLFLSVLLAVVVGWLFVGAVSPHVVDLSTDIFVAVLLMCLISPLCLFYDVSILLL